MLTNISPTVIQDYLTLYAIGHIIIWSTNRAYSYVKLRVTLEYKHLIKHHVHSSHQMNFKHCVIGECAKPVGHVAVPQPEHLAGSVGFELIE